MSGLDAVLVVAAGLAAGIVNAVAGGGSLILFPALLAVGYPSVTANVTNTAGLWPGYAAGAASYRPELARHRRRLPVLGGLAAAGGAVGSAVLLVAPPGVFKALVPYLVLAAVGLLAAQPRLQAALKAREGDRHPDHVPAGLYAAVFVGAIYGGYFGGGLGVVLLAVLGLFLPDDLNSLNGLKNLLSLIINTLALVSFALFGPVSWAAAALVAPASLLGGLVGARLAKRLPAAVLRRVVIVFGTLVAIRLFVA